MARRPFAGTAETVVQDAAGNFLPGYADDGSVLTRATVWTALTGGTQITDLQTAGGVAITGGFLIPDQYGRFGNFLGPNDGRGSLYIDTGIGTRVLLNTTDLPSRVATVETSVASNTTAITTLNTTTSALDTRVGTLEAGGGGGTGGIDQPSATAVVYSSQFRNSQPTTNTALFSWTCDGTADEVQINAAIAAVAAQGGGKVQLLGNSFSVADSIVMKTGISLVGEGYGTEIRPSGNFQDAVVVLSAVTDHATYLAHMTINCNSTQTHGIRYTCTTNEVFSSPLPDTNPDAMHVIEHIYINNPGNSTFAGHGMIIEGSGNRAGRYSNIRILSPSGCGLWQKGSVDSHFHMIEIGGAGGGGPTPSTSNTAPVGHGFYISQGDSCMYTSCKAWYSRAAGFYVRATRTAFSSCVAQDNHGPGWWCNFGKNTYASCHADSNGQGNGANGFVRAGFYVTADLSSFSSCSSFDRGGQSWAQQYGFQFTGGCSNSYVQAIVYGNAAGPTTGTPAVTTELNIRGQ